MHCFPSYVYTGCQLYGSLSYVIHFNVRYRLRDSDCWMLLTLVIGYHGRSILLPPLDEGVVIG
jgi:hypothetical protein